ncbi:MAG: stable inheritance protein KleA [Oscillibacter sp.]|nr:stable inheritance protein KleA [Oscillibacter sp.]
MGLTDQIKKTALKTAFSYLEKNPEENAPKLMAWVDKLAGNGPDSFQSQRDAIRAVINDPNNNMHQLVMLVWLHPHFPMSTWSIPAISPALRD